VPSLPRFLVIACAALSASTFCACTSDDPPVAANVELERFQGLWYEIARMPRDYDETCHDTIADYRLVSPNELEMTHTCHLDSPSGSLSQFRAPAKASDPRVPAKLTLDLGLYHGDYWILDVGKDYEYALIGHPSLTMLWILSRSPSLDEKTLASLENEAGRLGFAASALRMTPQSRAGAH
jgi:apolipoprotein D and lipocalin family protein